MAKWDYENTPSTLRIRGKIIEHHKNAKQAIASYLNTPDLYNGPHDVWVWIGPKWHCIYHASKRTAQAKGKA